MRRLSDDWGVTDTSAIELSGVWRRFGDCDVLRDVNLAVPPGEIHGLVGPNGAGKSTLLRIISALVAPTRGTVRLNGTDVYPGAPGIGFVPAGTRSFYLRLTGLQNLVFFGRLCGLSRDEAKARAQQLLGHVGLASAADRRVGLYSSGMNRRLGVARALLNDPKLLLVDEATHDLDPAGADAVRALVRDAARSGAAVIWATHRVEELRGFAHRVTVLDAGDQYFTGTMRDLLARVDARRYVIRVRGQHDRMLVDTAVRVAAGTEASIAPAEATDEYVVSLSNGLPLGVVITGLSRYRFDVLACREERPPLEQALLALTRNNG
jgi:ABC-2 type transport system ATP-binding protein